MAITQRERYVRNHENIKTRAIYSIFRNEKELFCKHLEAEEKRAGRWERKITEADLIDPFLDEIAPDVPEYLLTVLPKIMNDGAKEPIKRYKKLLPEGYSLAFDIDTSPASKYLQDLEDLMLSQKQWSILKTTRDELRTIMEKGVAEGNSYGTIAKAIREVDPWVFSKTRAKTIAVNEIGRAYGWANHEPGTVLTKEGYIMKKIWATSEDEKVRPEHMENEAEGWIDFEDTWTGTGDEFAPSTDINCRCTSTHQITGIKDGKSIVPIMKGTSPEEIAKKHFEIFGKKV